jgi:NADH-quinone oxidoreductase subunit M
MSGFVGEFLSLQSVFSIDPWAAWTAVIGLVVNAAVMLWMMQRILFGTKNPAIKPAKDANFREIISAIPLFCFTFFIGIFPSPILHLIERFVS